MEFVICYQKLLKYLLIQFTHFPAAGAGFEPMTMVMGENRVTAAPPPPGLQTRTFIFPVKPRIVRDNLRIATIKVGRSHTWTADVIGEPVTTKTWRSEKETSHIENHERITISNEDYSTTFSIKDAMRKVDKTQ